nr:MAG TPA: Sigma factor regulator N-terminal [Caudoviricetes sp.]
MIQKMLKKHKKNTRFKLIFLNISIVLFNI